MRPIWRVLVASGVAVLMALVLAYWSPDATNAAPVAQPAWKTVFNLGTLRPTSVATDGLSLFLFDAIAGRIVQIQLGPSMTLLSPLTEMPSPVVASPPGSNVFGAIVLGPTAYYSVVNTPSNPIPQLYRAERVPIAIRGGWRFLRDTGGPADMGLTAVSLNRIIWMLRSDATKGFTVDWQPVATESTFTAPPAGPSIDLGRSPRPRPAAGVTGSRDAIYVFGGRSTPFTVTLIPVAKGSPGTMRDIAPLRNARRGATALIHGSTVYLVGGNDPGSPMIERSRINADGSLGTWEKLANPPGTAGVISAVFARNALWIIRDDGTIQASSLNTIAGYQRVVWAGDQRPITVAAGEKVDIALDWTYFGPQDLTGVTASISASVANTKNQSGPFLRLTQQNFPDATLTAPTSSGPAVHIVGTIPSDGLRTDFLASVQLTAGGKLIGPLYHLHFVIPKAHAVQPRN